MIQDQDTSSKDSFFEQLARLSDAMTAAHGKDFAMGALVLAARFIAEKETRDDAATAENYKPDTSPPQSSLIIQ